MNAMAGPLKLATLSGTDDAEARLDIRSLIGVVLRHWKIALLTPLVLGVLTLAVLRVIPPRFVSSVEILIADPRHPANAVDQGHAALDVDAPAIDSEIEVLGSHAIAMHVAKALNLADDREFTRANGLSGLLATLGFSNTESVLAGETQAQREERAAGELLKRLTIERVRYSYALRLSITSTDPQKAQRIAAAVAQAYLDDQRAAQESAFSEGKKWLQGILSQMSARVQENESQIQKLKAENGLTDVGSNGNLSQQQTSDLNNQLVLARADLAERRARLEQARQVLKNGGNIQGIPEALSSPVIGQLRAQEADISRREAELASRFGPAYPDLITARSQLKDVKRAIDAEVGRILDNLKNAYEVALQREQSLESSLHQLTQGHDASSAVIRLGELQRVDASDRQLYENLLSSFNKITMRATLNDSAARIITPASLPTAPASPKQKTIMALMLVVGSILGVVLAVLAEHLSPGIKTSVQAEAALGLPVLGMILDAQRNSAQKSMMSQLLEAPSSRLSESVRAARVRLKLSKGEPDPRLVLVTSCLPKEGKTTSAMLLAASSAISGRRTLLVDCDFRRKSTSELMGHAHKPGFADLLEGRISVDEAVTRDEVSGLFIMTAGSSELNPADLLNARRTEELLDDLRRRFDFVVLDAPPLLPVADARILADYVERIVFVVRWDHTPTALANAVLRDLGEEIRQLTAVLVNRADLKKLTSSGYGYGAGYQYGRAYGRLGSYYS